MRALVMTADLQRLGEVQAFLTTDLPSDFAALSPSVQLVLEEFLVNVVNYAYRAGPGPLEVSRRMVVFDGSPHLAVMVRDWGPAFNPFVDADRPDVEQNLDERAIGGLGIHLVRSMATHYSYFRSCGANTVEVWFKQPNVE
jgi:anti-sigma regulatory factor (Ser/Thr protein kinase)